MTRSDWIASKSSPALEQATSELHKPVAANLELRMQISGHVQRVRFRLYVREAAVDLGLTGWVRNRGRQVEILAQGDQGQLEAFVAAVQEGPPGAVVEKVAKNVTKVRRALHRFRIRWFYIV